MSSMTDEQLAEVYIAERALARLRRYLLDGRRLRQLGDDALDARWARLQLRAPLRGNCDGLR